MIEKAKKFMVTNEERFTDENGSSIAYASLFEKINATDYKFSLLNMADSEKPQFVKFCNIELALLETEKGTGLTIKLKNITDGEGETHKSLASLSKVNDVFADFAQDLFMQNLAMVVNALREYLPYDERFQFPSDQISGENILAAIENFSEVFQDSAVVLVVKAMESELVADFDITPNFKQYYQTKKFQLNLH